MPTPLCCPECGVDLRGEPIPEDQRLAYGGATHFRREIGVTIRGVYDGVLFWACPDCGARWHRWDRTSPLRSKAEPYVEGMASPDSPVPPRAPAEPAGPPARQ